MGRCQAGGGSSVVGIGVVHHLDNLPVPEPRHVGSQLSRLGLASRPHDDDHLVAGADDLHQLAHSASPAGATHEGKGLRAVVTGPVRVRVAAVPFHVRGEELGDEVEIAVQGRLIPTAHQLNV